MKFLEKKCQEDVERALQDERKKSAAEIAKIKETFLTRERETTEDLRSLEELHAVHIKKLVNIG
jgi:hypothetical protein